MEDCKEDNMNYRFRSMIAQGDWIISVEVDPPRGFSAQSGIEIARRLQDAGADCVDVGDSPLASIRMSPVAFAVAVQQKVGIEAIVHLGARDRNLLALRSDIMGAHMLGARSIIALSGDPLKPGRYAGATAVWDVRAEGLIELIAEINEEIQAKGNTSIQEEPFTIGAAANPNNPDVISETQRMQLKADNGADIFFTQPTFNMSTIETFSEHTAVVARPLILGVLVLSTARSARQMAQVPGIEVSDEIVRKMDEAGASEKEMGEEITEKFIEQIRPFCAGIYLIPTAGSIDSCVRLVRNLKK